MCTFHCSAEQKIIIDRAASSRDFPAATAVGREESVEDVCLLK